MGGPGCDDFRRDRFIVGYNVLWYNLSGMTAYRIVSHGGTSSGTCAIIIYLVSREMQRVRWVHSAKPGDVPRGGVSVRQAKTYLISCMATCGLRHHGFSENQGSKHSKRCGRAVVRWWSPVGCGRCASMPADGAGREAG